MVRRSERALGVAIRQGQEDGTVRSKGEGGGPTGDYLRGESTVHIDPVRDSNMISPKQFFTHGTDAVQTYAVTDDVTDAQFDAALETAKEEGNLSRANVVRKVVELGSCQQRQADKWATIRSSTIGYSPSTRMLYRCS